MLLRHMSALSTTVDMNEDVVGGAYSKHMVLAPSSIWM